MAAELVEENSAIEARERTGAGVAYAVGAFVAWGLLPLYFQWLKHIDPMEILAQRVWWTFVTVVLVQAALGRLGDMRVLVRSKRVALAWLAASLCIGSNWLIFVYAATHGQVLETSLGYFICPLLNVLLGVVVLGERLTRVSAIAVGLAALAVGVLIVYYARVPLIALSLAGSFAVYGLLRKTLKADPLTGLLGDTLFLVPAAAAYLLFGIFGGTDAFVNGTSTDRILLYLLAPITLIPLGWFAAGAKRLPLATVGFVQYLAPSISFLCATFVLHEQLAWPRVAAFGLIWLGLALYTADALKRRAA